MTINRSEIVERVRSLAGFSSSAAGRDGYAGEAFRIDTLICRLFEEEAARMLSGLTPAEIGMNTDILGSGKSWEPVFRWSMRTDGLAVATARLPEDCLRLLAFRMGSWEVELRDVTFSDSLRRSPVEELRGTPERPRLYLLPSDGGVQLEIQACASIGEDCLCALYLPRPTWSSPQDSESTISLPHSLLPSLCKATAAHFTA